MNFLAKYGPWAVVTGASSGIGRELAKQIAARGLGVALVARRQGELEALARELKETYKAQTLVLAHNLSEVSGRRALLEATQELPVGLLVNSAGFGSGGEFLRQDVESELDMVEVNCKALLELTHHFGNRFVQQKRGGIILLSSLVAFQGVPYSANYAATKAYVQSLSEALASELSASGVDVLSAAPGPVASGFGSRAGMKMGQTDSPKVVAEQTLQALGRSRHVTPGLLSKFLTASLSTAPRFLRVQIMKGIMRGMT